MEVNIIKKAREKKGYTQEYMAFKLGYKDKSSYTYLEQGKVKLTIENARKISEILEIDPYIFFSKKV